MQFTILSIAQSESIISSIFPHHMPYEVRIPLMITEASFYLALSSQAIQSNDDETTPVLNYFTYSRYFDIVRGRVILLYEVRLVAPIPQARYYLSPYQQVELWVLRCFVPREKLLTSQCQQPSLLKKQQRSIYFEIISYSLGSYEIISGLEYILLPSFTSKKYMVKCQGNTDTMKSVIYFQSSSLEQKLRIKSTFKFCGLHLESSSKITCFVFFSAYLPILFKVQILKD